MSTINEEFTDARPEEIHERCYSSFMWGKVDQFAREDPPEEDSLVIHTREFYLVFICPGVGNDASTAEVDGIRVVAKVTSTPHSGCRLEP